MQTETGYDCQRNVNDLYDGFRKALFNEMD